MDRRMDGWMDEWMDGWGGIGWKAQQKQLKSEAHQSPPHSTIPQTNKQINKQTNKMKINTTTTPMGKGADSKQLNSASKFQTAVYGVGSAPPSQQFKPTSRSSWEWQHGHQSAHEIKQQCGATHPIGRWRRLTSWVTSSPTLPGSSSSRAASRGWRVAASWLRSFVSGRSSPLPSINFIKQTRPTVN